MQALKGLNAFETLAVWLGSINILLAIFNLIPGFPLDGGRILRSILWALTKNLKKATRWASYVGQALAWALIIMGVGMVFGVNIPFFGQGLVSGVWLVLIGWFLNNAASRSYQQLVIRDILEDVPVRKMTMRNPHTVPGHISVEKLIEDFIMQTDDQAFPVIEDGNLLGIVTLDDVRRVPGDERLSKTVADIMTPRKDLITLGSDDSANEALKAISQNAIRQVIILDHGEFFGLVRRRDIVRYLHIQSDEFNPLSSRRRKI
jgi:predicted transcriptional regulator